MKKDVGYVGYYVSIIIIGIVWAFVTFFLMRELTLNNIKELNRCEEATLKQLELEFRHKIAKGTDFMFLGHNCYGLKNEGAICKTKSSSTKTKQ